MTSEQWFDNLTRALAGGGGRRGFLRLLGGSIAGAALGAALARESKAAPAGQTTTCTPRPRVAVTNTPTSTGLNVTVATTGSGNAITRITFGTLRNGTV